MERGALALLLSALFLSGVAGIANQVLWQRALKVFLGGSETISSLVVVLVFMLGLGVGAGIAGAIVWRSLRPSRVLALVEFFLFAVNIALAWLFSLDVRETVYTFERFALTLGIPLRLVYALGALLVLLLPTILMGSTLPIASEACQRQLGAKRTSLLPILFFLNTFGAVAGAFGSSFFLLPVFGQAFSLMMAAVLNLCAALLLLILSGYLRPGARGPKPPHLGKRFLGGLPVEAKLGAFLGFLSLGYEIYLFRLIALAHMPLPYTFSVTLCLFLLFWSVGVFAAAYVDERIRTGLLLGALSITLVPALYTIDRWEHPFRLFGAGLLYFVPCLAFGSLYGMLVARSAKQWGHDVGRFYAANTAGSCLGILFFTLVGYEIALSWNAFLIAAGLVTLAVHVARQAAGSQSRRRWLAAGQGALGLLLAAILLFALSTPYTTREHMMTFWGRDGVVEVTDTGVVFIDGLFHTRLSNGTSHLGENYTWMMAFAAIFAHSDQPMTDALVVGNGVGITATTLAKLDGLEVDAYEINHTLKRVLRTFPDATLRVAENPRVHIYWRDARTAMALNPKRYDLIVSAPLQLKQAGASLLLSKEYMDMVRARLKHDGVFVAYSQEGKPEQTFLIQRTVRSVFLHTRTLLHGLITIASDSPIDLSRESIAARLARPDAFYREAAAVNEKTPLHTSIDPAVSLAESKYIVSDDHPILEYPDVLVRLLREEREMLSRK